MDPQFRVQHRSRWSPRPRCAQRQISPSSTAADTNSVLNSGQSVQRRCGSFAMSLVREGPPAPSDCQLAWRTPGQRLRETNLGMLVAIVTPSYEPEIGGIESYTGELSRALVRAGCHVEVITKSAHGASKTRERPESSGDLRVLRF